MTNDRFLRWLDRSVAWTGVPALTRNEVPRRHLRWWPLVAMVLATLALGWCLAGRSFWLGYWCVLAVQNLSILVMVFGPLPRADQRMDEFDRDQARYAWSAGFAAATIAGLLGTVGTSLLLLGERWTAEVAGHELMALASYMAVLLFNVPVLRASWATDPIGEDA